MKLISLISFFCVPFLLFSQVLITEGEFETRGADPSSVLELASTHGGLLIPRMETKERDEIKNPVEGLLIYNLEESCLNVFSKEADGWLTYCTIRYSEDCRCIEYLYAYDSPSEEWVPLLNGEDADWHDPSTSKSPTSIHDDLYTLGQVFIGDEENQDDEYKRGKLTVFAKSESYQNGIKVKLEGETDSNDGLPTSLHLQNNIQNSNFQVGVFSSITGRNDASVLGLYNFIDTDGDGNKFSIYNPFSSDGNGDQTAIYNTFSADGTGDTYGMKNGFGDRNTGTNYGVYSNFLNHSGIAYGTYNHFNSYSDNIEEGPRVGSYNKYSSAGGTESYGSWNLFEDKHKGKKTGQLNEFSSSTQPGVVYGVHNKISNDSPQNKYGMYNNISNDDGTAYGIHNFIITSQTNSNNQYGTYNRIVGGSGTNYGGYFATNGAGNMGIYAKNTTTDGYAGAFNGDVEVGNGYLTIGDQAPGINNLDNSMVRHGVWEHEFGRRLPSGHPDNDDPIIQIFRDNFDGIRYINLGVIDLPDHVSGPVIATKVIMETTFLSYDIDEAAGFKIAFKDENYTGSEGWMGHWELGIKNSQNYRNFNFNSRRINIPITDQQNIRCKIYDEDNFVSSDDDVAIYGVKIKVYYEYTSTLKDGDIAASGLIYSNTNSQMGDLAEYFEVGKEEGIANGLIVSFKPGTDNEYEIAKTPYSNFIVGVISENPSVVLNNPNVGPPIALAGRVKVKVSPESGVLIKSGDYLTTSSIPGTAMIARRPGRVIGYAVTNQKPGEDYVEILVQPGHYAPTESQ